MYSLILLVLRDQELIGRVAVRRDVYFLGRIYAVDAKWVVWGEFIEFVTFVCLFYHLGFLSGFVGLFGRMNNARGRLVEFGLLDWLWLLNLLLLLSVPFLPGLASF